MGICCFSGLQSMSMYCSSIFLPTIHTDLHICMFIASYMFTFICTTDSDSAFSPLNRTGIHLLLLICVFMFRLSIDIYCTWPYMCANESLLHKHIVHYNTTYMYPYALVIHAPVIKSCPYATATHACMYIFLATYLIYVHCPCTSMVLFGRAYFHVNGWLCIDKTVLAYISIACPHSPVLIILA